MFFRFFIPKQIVFLVLTFLLICNYIYAQENKEIQYRAMFYNVENLFDIYDDSLINDNEFLPGESKRWTHKRFETKLINIYKTIVVAGKGNLPDLIGLCEVENAYCLQSLIDKTPLWKNDFKFIHFNSPDKRGIDVALLYNSTTFIPLHSEAVPVHFSNTDIKTRDILYVKGVVASDTLHVFVNHWPSKRGGAEKSEPKRKVAALVLKQKVDSIMATNKHAKIIIGGDFNESAKEEALYKVLRAAKPVKNDTLINLSFSSRNSGTHKYRGKWDFLDHIIVSQTIADSNSSYTFSVVNEPFLLCEDPSWTGTKPFRTYQGPRYVGGFSDHLPVILTVYK